MSAASTRLLIATTNRGKLREVREILFGTSIAVLDLSAFPGTPEAVEDGATFEANARIKASHYARHTGCWTLADDSGLCVDALAGAPGVHSARYAGPLAGDMANNRKLIAALQDVPMERRTARFVCAMALVKPAGANDDEATVVATSRGEVEGFIIDTPRGHNGFGYDPHFYIPEMQRTTAELPPNEKNAISHRGKALRAISTALHGLCTPRKA